METKEIKFTFPNQCVVILAGLDFLVDFCFILNFLLINEFSHYRWNFVLLNKAHNLY